ncbi:MAG: hypothetical protein WDO19_10375 [Bacteroidota bacterium]
MLNSIGKQNPYSVPDGYFENFGKDVNLKSDNKPVAKTVLMVNRKWFRFAAAAVVIGFIAITGVSLFFIKQFLFPIRMNGWREYEESEHR